MIVSQLMKQSVCSCNLNDPLNVAAQIMWEHDCGCVPVINNEGRVVGMITDRDICMAAYLEGGPLSDLRVSSAMATKVVACRPNTTMAQAGAMMREHQVRRLPVVDATGNLVGILSLNDIAVEAGHETERKNKEVTFAEAGRTLAATCRPRRGNELAI